MPEVQLAEMPFNVKISQETEALRARLPAQLAPFASNISIVEPMQTICVSPNEGVHLSGCAVEERRICMQVAVVPSTHSQSQDSESLVEESHTKSLKLVWQDWSQTARYTIATADSQMYSISLKYGALPDGMHPTAKAFTGGYFDGSGIHKLRSSHGGIKSVVEEVVRDMGLRECELDNKAEVIGALLGDDGMYLLESWWWARRVDETPLREIIEYELEEKVFREAR